MEDMFDNSPNITLEDIRNYCASYILRILNSNIERKTLFYPTESKLKVILVVPVVMWGIPQ
jgi:hypothetical protein